MLKMFYGFIEHTFITRNFQVFHTFENCLRNISPKSNCYDEKNRSNVFQEFSDCSMVKFIFKMHYFISFWKNQKLESCSAIRSLGENLTLKKTQNRI